MTEEESARLAELHEALFNVPPGSPSDEKPLIHELRILVRAYKRTSWMTRMVVWALPTLAGLGVAAKSIYGWFIQ